MLRSGQPPGFETVLIEDFCPIEELLRIMKLAKQFHVFQTNLKHLHKLVQHHTNISSPLMEELTVGSIFQV